MEGPVNEATAVYPSVHIQLQSSKSVYPRDMKRPVNEATAEHPSNHRQQHI
eukprot:CAMPEP_0185018766 /NCGR_PEP_ID=MMETSP1103-20130426/1436_1 /TAXON_ID=36769 /ORGANISM="Paraphysomonas bandaiensis, Strain Caron Lab Isolate" /LENGTH=50 /DNA_ID=CAMNT_0027548731 /DNA_START=1 /DNA_END=153 /DNA_ORIENTATION=+